MATIHGRLLGARSRKPLADLRVEAWIIDPNRKRVQIGEGVSDGEGSFTIEVAPRAADVFFRVLRGEEPLFDTADSIVWNERQGETPVLLGVPDEATLPPDREPDPGGAVGGPLSAAGVVTNEHGVAAANLRVEVWDRNVDGATLLAATATDASGRYAVDYDPALLKGKAGADLEIRVLDPARDSAELARSAVLYKAPDRAVSDLVVEATAVARTPEYERLRQTLEPLLGDRSLERLDPDGVTYLAERTGWDARAVAMAAQATKLSGSTGIAPEHYYALLRSGAPGTAEDLHRLSDEQLAGALKTAVANRLIADDQSIDETIRRHRAEARRVLRDVRAPGAVSTLGDMLRLELDDRAQEQFIDVYRAVGDDQAALWPRLADAGFDKRTIARLRTGGALGKLTLQNAPVVERLQRTERIGALEDLATAGFHDPARWTAVIGADVPQGLTAEAYAAGLAAQVNLNAPTLVTADLVNKQALRVDASEEVSSFLSKSHAKHKIGVDPVKTWEGFGELSDTGRDGALLVERLYQVSPSNQSMVTLSQLGIESALQIASYPREAFMEKFGGEFQSKTELALVHQKATQIATTTLNVATMYLAHRSSPNVYALSGKTSRTAPEAVPDVVVTATLEDLFTNLDYCACEHCNSVFSPAAYLVELLEFLDLSDVPHTQGNPINVLLGRRPDLQHLLLSCENTNVALPYVDIVNEVLEHYVVNGNLTAFAGFNMGSDAETADLLADPQFVQDAAYDATTGEVYPWSLPFDMALAAMRLLFQVWDTTLAEALEVFGDTAGARRERLGLNGAEHTILTEVGFRALPEYFGEPAGASIDDLNDAVANAKTFCRRVDITYEDLAEILKTRFVNPAIVLVPNLELLRTNIAKIQDWFDGVLDDGALTALFPADLDTAPFGGDVLGWLTANRDTIMHLITMTDVSPEPVECDFAQVELRFALPKAAENRLTDIAYLRLHRFIRLWRKLGQGVELTDKLITTFGAVAPADLTPANIDAAFATLLDRIANFQRLLAVLDVSKKNIADWLSLWDATLAADVRHDRLAGLLRIGTTDLSDLIEITGIDPFASDMGADEPSMLRLALTWRALKASPLKVADLDYLLRDQDLSGKLAPAEEELLRDIKALRDALGAVETEVGIAVANPDLSAAKSKMTLVYDAAVVDRFFALISHSASYSAPFESVEETLPAPLAQVSTGIELDPFAKALTLTGIMGPDTQASLNAASDALVLADVTEIQTQADLDAFIATFKIAVQALRDAGDADLASFAAEFPELSSVVSAVDVLSDPAAKATAVLEAILPELRAQLKVRALRTALAAITKADGPVVHAITAGPDVLHTAADGTAGVLDDFRALEDTAELDANQTFELLVDPVATGDYVLYVAAPETTQVTLVLDGTVVIPATAVGASGEVRSNVPIALTTGSLQRLDVTLGGLPAGESARLRWRTKAIAKADVPASRITSKARADAARTSLLRVRKATMLRKALDLTAGELVHLAARDPATQGVLDALDTDGSIATAALNAQWGRVERIVWFQRLKADHERDPDTLLGLLGEPDRATAQGKLVLAGVMEWDEPSLTAVLAHQGLALTDLAELDNLRAVARTMELVTKTLQPGADLIAWAVANPDGALVQSAKASLRARMTDAAWRESMQSVSDALRNARRDALVAYILFHDPPAPEITTPDRLYEHFLLDVQMDACMQTSRIRLALSAVQMFVNRCLMNLEANVAPASIRADRWQWMQRYRVWEANRKVFIHPENWLEPELRDGKTPFFRELESELLKSDITDELAEEAYLSYLKKLDDVAKLEVVAAYLHQRQPSNPDDDILHVFARTNGATRQYYSRRFEYGYWTPWEKMSLNIEGDLLVPVVWKSQLFVFWVKTVTKSEGGDRNKTPRKIADEGWGANALTTTELTLSWGEFYKGKWTSPKSTEIKDPLRITGLSAFDASKLVISARTERPNPNVSERLIFSVLYLGGSTTAHRVTFTSKHSAPLIEAHSYELFGDSSGFLAEIQEPVKAFNYTLFWAGQTKAALDSNSLLLFDRTFEVGITQPSGGSDKPKHELVLTKTGALLTGFRVRPVMHPVENQWEAPFFYSDEHSVFFVQGDELVWNDSWFDVFYDPGPVVHIAVKDIPVLYEQPVIPDKGDPVINPWVEVVNPNFNTIITDNTQFEFEGTAFNARGRVGVKGGL